MIRTLNHWLAGRSERERILLGILAGLIALVMIYGAIWLPLRFWERHAQQSLRMARAQQADLHFLQAQPAQSGPTNIPAGPELVLLAGNDPLQTRLTRSAATVGLELKPIQSGEGGVTTIELAHARNAVLLHWLALVESQSRIEILRADIEPETDGAGGLHAKLQLSERRQ